MNQKYLRNAEIVPAISVPNRNKGSGWSLSLIELGIGCTAAGLVILAVGGGLERDTVTQPQPYERTDTPHKEPAAKSGKPPCTEVASRDEVEVVSGDSVYKIAEQEMPEISNVNKAANWILAMNGIDPTDPTIHPGDELKIPIEACVVQK